MQIEQEAELSPSETVFLDQGYPDAMAYYRFESRNMINITWCNEGSIL